MTETARSPSQLGDFFEPPGTCPVLVELGTRTPGTPLAASLTRDATLKRLKEIAGVDPQPAFDERVVSTTSLAATRTQGGLALPDFAARFAVVPRESVNDARELAALIKTELPDGVVEATPQPLAIPALGPSVLGNVNIAAATPDFRNLQGHLGFGPNGVNAFTAWAFPGGSGQDITVIDLEGGWRTTHEDLATARFNLWEGEATDFAAWTHHGTAVAGIVNGTWSESGISGVAPGARLGFVSIFPAKQPFQRLSNQILKSASMLRPGDVLLIPLQRPGPNAQFDHNVEQKGYVPVSYWRDVELAIEHCVRSGICVVEAAGNGAENLDDEVYQHRFDQAQHDSGSILVGAGAPPNARFGPARSRMTYSNYGTRLDCQAWGECVTTSGYGNLWDGNGDADRAYTHRFAGTSSAASIVAGVIACVQGRQRAVRGTPFPPQILRRVLAGFGWIQTEGSDAPLAQRIGPQPDLFELFKLFELV